MDSLQTSIRKQPRLELAAQSNGDNYSEGPNMTGTHETGAPSPEPAAKEVNDQSGKPDDINAAKGEDEHSELKGGGLLSVKDEKDNQEGGETPKISQGDAHIWLYGFNFNLGISTTTPQ